MGSRLKEDEKNERAIRSLLRKTPNRRCVNCNSLGPQYVCLNFWTFVCTQCSGIHREFTHRVKSVSMSKFTSEEVANLESGGNERAREIFFKDWDSQRQPLPDSSNVDRLREFIKMVYVERRFSGEKPLSRGGGGDRESRYDSRPRPNYRPDSRSPPYEERYDERPPGGRRSNMGYDDRRWEERGSRYDEKSSPGRFESERNRYDRGYSDNRSYDVRSRYDSRDRQQYEDREVANRRLEDRFANERGIRNYGGSSPPPVFPVKEILGEDVPPLRVESPGRQANGGGRSQDDRRQRFGSSSSFGSVDGNAPVAAPAMKREEPTSLIDFSTEPDPPAAQQQSDLRGLTSAVEQSADASSSTGWATFDMFSSAPAGPAPSLVAPATLSTPGVSELFTSQSTQINGDSNWATQWGATSISSAVELNTNNWSTLAANAAPATTSQHWNAFQASATKPSTSSAAAIPSVASSAGVAPTAAPVQPAGRQAIPEDFFNGPPSNLQFIGTSSFGPQDPSMTGMGMFAGNYNQFFQPQQLKKSMNPFDLPGDGPSVGTAVNEFPSLAPLQAALPPVNSVGTLPASGPGFAAYGPQWSQPNSVARPQTFNSPGLVPQASGFFVSQQPLTAASQIMQLPLGPSGGVTMPGGGVTISAGFTNVPKQGTDAVFPSSNFSSLPSQNSFAGGKQGPDALFPSSGFPSLPSQNSFAGGTGALFTAQGAHFPYQNPGAPVFGHATSVGPSFMPGQGMPGVLPQHRLLSQGSLGSLSSMSGANALFASQPPLPGQQLVSHSSLGPLNSTMGLDSQFSVPTPSQFPNQSSVGSNGNPFG